MAKHYSVAEIVETTGLSEACVIAIVGKDGTELPRELCQSVFSYCESVSWDKSGGLEDVMLANEEDPFLRKERDKWMLVLCTGIKGPKGIVGY